MPVRTSSRSRLTIDMHAIDIATRLCRSLPFNPLGSNARDRGGKNREVPCSFTSDDRSPHKPGEVGRSPYRAAHSRNSPSRLLLIIPTGRLLMISLIFSLTTSVLSPAFFA